jgi:hypothetical protein
MLQKFKHDHSGHRNIQPDRERDSGEAAVHHEPTAQREKQRRQDQGQRDDR